MKSVLFVTGPDSPTRVEEGSVEIEGETVSSHNGSSVRPAGTTPRFHLRPRPVSVVGGDVAGARDDFDLDSKYVAVGGLSSTKVVRSASEATIRSSTPTLERTAAESSSRKRNSAPESGT